MSSTWRSASARPASRPGWSRTLARKLARWTVAGAGELLHRSDLGADTLRQNVTSPGGTTFAALEVLMADEGMPKLMREAVAAATKQIARACEIARNR